MIFLILRSAREKPMRDKEAVGLLIINLALSIEVFLTHLIKRAVVDRTAFIHEGMTFVLVESP